MTYFNDKVEDAWLAHFMSMEPSSALDQIDVLVTKHIEADNTRVAGFFMSIKEILHKKPLAPFVHSSPMARHTSMDPVTKTHFNSLSQSSELMLPQTLQRQGSLHEIDDAKRVG